MPVPSRRAPEPRQGLCWVIDDAYLKEPGPRAEGVADAADTGNPGVSAAAPVLRADAAAAAASPGPVTPVLYVSPTSGQLSPGEESRIRLTFTPNRAGVLTFALPVWLARVPERGTRPYLTLHVKVKQGRRAGGPGRGQRFGRDERRQEDRGRVIHRY